MSTSHLLLQATVWLAWAGLGLAVLTLIAVITRWGAKFRLIGATIFAFLLSGSCWAFSESYSPPLSIDGAIYAPVVYDNGYDLVIAQAPEDFPKEATQASLEQIAGNLKGGGRNGAKVHIRIRTIKSVSSGISRPVILGEVIKDMNTNNLITIEVNKEEESLSDDFEIENQLKSNSTQKIEFERNGELTT